MKSLATEGFWRALERLPLDVRRQAQRAYQRFQDDPFHPSLHFKRIDDADNVWSVRIGLGYRAFGLREGEDITWIWIGSHAEYDRRV
ncbi:MAG: hypothetical protein WD733_04650 [Bryobacterales bacterium]